jgi:hypothetical protein
MPLSTWDISQCCCPRLCGCPAPDTLNFNDSLFGSTTLSWTGSVWVGTIAYSAPGTIDCPAALTTITITLFTSCDLTYEWAYDLGGICNCPGDAGIDADTVGSTTLAMDQCSPLDLTFHIGPGSVLVSCGNAESLLWNGNGFTVATITA